MKFLNLIFTYRGTNLGLLILRIAFGAMMLSHGFAKLAYFDGPQTEFANPIGIGSFTSLVMITATEVGASILVILGLLTRPVAFVLMFAMAVAAFIVHSPFTFSGSELPLVYLMVYLTLVITGAGKYSLDRIILQRLRAKYPQLRGEKPTA